MWSQPPPQSYFSFKFFFGSPIAKLSKCHHFMLFTSDGSRNLIRSPECITPSGKDLDKITMQRSAATLRRRAGAASSRRLFNPLSITS